MEIDKTALLANLELFRSVVNPKVEVWAVVKSNAYGHGLFEVADILKNLVNGFCVDSVAEGEALRKRGIKSPILVLGPTLPALFSVAYRKKLTLTIADIGTLRKLSSRSPNFHLKFDTGMRRQGFLPSELSRVLNFLRGKNLPLRGIYSHFAGDEVGGISRYREQFALFEALMKSFSAAGYNSLKRHIAATDGVLQNADFHLDMVRIGMGFYGGTKLFHQGKVFPGRPVLSWRTVVSALKTAQAGDRVGYAPSEILAAPSKLAILPIGYWHGFPRALSRIGEVLVRGRRARVVGLVSMDLLTVEVTNIPGIRVGDMVTIIGSDLGSVLTADDLARPIQTVPYEILTRTNPLMRRFVV